MTAAPSIAAVVASYEDTYFHYPGSTRLQATKDDDKKSIEMILDLYMMMVERLNLYKSKNGRLPSTLLYIRDGVGDGQFAQVVDEEVPQIKRACKQLYEVSLPTIPPFNNVLTPPEQPTTKASGCNHTEKTPHQILPGRRQDRRR